MTTRDFSSGVLATDLVEGTSIAGQLAEDEVLLVRSGGSVFAVGASCPHYHAPLADGAIIDGTIRCPWHHACFDLRSGAVLRAPALVPLPAWQVEERDGRLFVGSRLEPAQASVPTAPRSVVIIGAGAAGVNVADTLRTEGYDGKIVIISADPDLPYDKPNLSKDFLAGNAPADWLPLHPAEHYDEQRIELRLGVNVSSIDVASKAITTSSGERLPYDALVLATGAAPRRLTVPGAENVNYVRTRADVERLVASIANARNAVVIGAGFIGLEVAASLRQRGLDVTVVSPDAVPLQRVLGPVVGARIRELHESHGVVFQLGRSVASIDGRSVLLDDGTRVDGDVIIAGVGVTPSVDLAQAAGLEVGNGIAVDQYLQTSAEGVFACGDVAAWTVPGADAAMRVEHWVVAGRQGQTVARNILGKREAFRAVPFFWSAHYDVVVAYVGHAAGWDTVDVRGSLEQNDATIIYRASNRVLAVATIGRDAVGLAVEDAMERRDRSALEAILQ
jgi:NADPH-dependent 2,4-dienoyl-CoA reductase/sulfur reductase-like enzyme/nitrite reductase/ring-hydroxylating ferredoxin subunit